MRIWLILLPLPLLPVLGSAQTNTSSFTLDGNIRYRLEKYHKYNTKNYGDRRFMGDLEDALLLQRIIIGITGPSKAPLGFALHVQDSRAFGWSLRNALQPNAFRIGDKQGSRFYRMNPQEEFIELYDAYLSCPGFIKNSLILLGRQKIFCADYRIFGPGEWGNTGRWTWDALRWQWSSRRASVDVWAGGTKIHDPEKTFLPFTHTEFSGGGFYSSYKTGTMAVDLFAAVKKPGTAEFAKDQDFSRYWTGLRLERTDSSGAVYELNYTYGFGSQKRHPIRSFGFFAKAGWSFGSLLWKPILTLRYSYAGGDDPLTRSVETFDPVYGAGDKYYGWMNLVPWSNLDDHEMMLELFPKARARIEIKYNRFLIPHYTTSVNGTLTLPKGRKKLGDEIDLWIRYPLSKPLTFTFAFGTFVPKEARLANGGIPEAALWGAWQAEYRFTHKIGN